MHLNEYSAVEVTVSLESFEKTKYFWLGLVSADTTKTTRINVIV